MFFLKHCYTFYFFYRILRKISYFVLKILLINIKTLKNIQFILCSRIPHSIQHCVQTRTKCILWIFCVCLGLLIAPARRCRKQHTYFSSFFFGSYKNLGFDALSLVSSLVGPLIIPVFLYHFCENLRAHLFI